MNCSHPELIAVWEEVEGVGRWRYPPNSGHDCQPCALERIAAAMERIATALEGKK